MKASGTPTSSPVQQCLMSHTLLTALRQPRCVCYLTLSVLGSKEAAMCRGRMHRPRSAAGLPALQHTGRDSCFCLLQLWQDAGQDDTFLESCAACHQKAVPLRRICLVGLQGGMPMTQPCRLSAPRGAVRQPKQTCKRATWCTMATTPWLQLSQGAALTGCSSIRVQR